MASTVELLNKNGKPLEELAQQVAQKMFPDAIIGHETGIITVTVGECVKRYLPDLDFAFPDSPVQRVLTEMTCSPYVPNYIAEQDTGQPDLFGPKGSQMRIVRQYTDHHPEEVGLAWFGQNMATPDAFLGTLAIVEKLGTGQMDADEAQIEVNQIALQNEVFTLGLTTALLFEEVLKSLL
jgi:hypothetical protein